MRALLRFLGKELAEIVRTWRVWVVLGVLGFFAVLSPVAAKYTPLLISSLGTGQQGVVIKIPEPTYIDSYLQWVKNLGQIGMMLVLFASAGLIAGERASGTAALVVTKPVSRTSFVVAKYLSQALLVTIATALGVLIVLGGTQLLFHTAPAARVAAATAAWLGVALVAVALAEALSAAFPTIAAAILSLLVWALSGVVSLWRPAVDYSPIGLLGAPADLLAGKRPDLLWPGLTAVMAVVALVAVAAAVFSRKEL